MVKHGADWIIQRYILRERGITVTGPDPKMLIAPVLSADLRWAVSEILQNWIKHFLDDPGQLKVTWISIVHSSYPVPHSIHV